MAKQKGDLVPFDYPLNGRLITKLDGTLLPDAHFQVLENLRYNDGGIEGVGGMTKVKATAFTTYTKVQNGFHFKKTSPVAEDHILVQVSSGSVSHIYKSDTSANVPSADTYTDFVTLDSTDTVFFSDAPDGSMVFCDGYKNYVYSGDEYRAAKVINFDPAGSFFKDHSNIATNSLTDSDNVFVLSGVAGGTDAYTESLYHFDNSPNDATAGAHDLTANNITYSTSGMVFGTHWAVFNGTTGYFNFAIGAHAEFDYDGGIFTIDGRTRTSTLADINPLFYMYTTDDDNMMSLHIETDGSLHFEIKAAASTVVSVTTPASVIAINTTYHIAVVENGDDFYIFVDGKLQGYSSDTDRAAAYDTAIWYGRDATKYFTGNMDEWRTCNGVARWTSDFEVPLSAYSASTNVVHVYIGATRPLSGVKFYVNVANTTAAVATGFYWNGSAWTALASLSDGTSASAKTLAQDGTITFTSTVTTAKVKVINENLAYYYYLVFTDVDATTALEMVTVKAPVQELVDIWDGVPRQIYSFVEYKTSYTDATTAVYSLDYDSSDTTTYHKVVSLTSAQYIYCGFNERLMGLKLYFGGTYVNTTTSVLYIDYWNGTTWTTVGTIDDGTSVSGKTLARTGTVTWNDPGATNEFTTSIGNSSQWFYYRVRVSATTAADVRIDNITGIPVQVNLPPYRYPVLWQNRLFLLNDTSKNRNTCIGSSYGTVCVFNGRDSGILQFGDMKDIECGQPLFTRYGSSLYENLIVCKKNETYLVDGTSFTGDGNGSGAYVVYKVSGTRGCIAPLSMKGCETGYEVAPGLTKHILAWLSASGVVMFDSNSIIEVSNDIGDRFERRHANYINTSYSDKSSAFYDSVYGEYHLMIATGSTATPNEEWAYDVIRKKWYQVKRSTKYLWCGWEVEDSKGNKYVYGGTSDGYIERLEYGTTFDGVSIAYKFRLPDSLMDQSWAYRKEIRQIRLVGVCKTTSSETVTVSHYADGATSASTPAVTVIPQTNTGYGYYKWARSVSFRGTTHSLEFSISTDDETTGFEPLFVSGVYRTI